MKSGFGYPICDRDASNSSKLNQCGGFELNAAFIDETAKLRQ